MIAVSVLAALDGSTWQTPRGDMTWTDITPWVSHEAGVSIDRGRATSRDEVRAGSCQFTLLDRNRTFDPENTAGAHYGKLNPGVPIWVQVVLSTGSQRLTWGTDPLLWGTSNLTWGSGSSASRFFGFVEDWPQGSTNPADRVVSIPVQAFDAFAMLALGRQRSILDNAILGLDPLGYWPLGESSGSTVAVDAAGSRDGVAFDEPGFGSEPMAPGLGPSVEFDGNDRIDLTRSLLLQTPATSAVVAVVRTETNAVAGYTRPVFIQINGSPFRATSAQLFVDSVGKACFVGTLNGSGNAYRSSVAITDGEPHLLFGMRSLASGVAVDSAQLQTTEFTQLPVPGNGAAIGGTPYSSRGFSNHYFKGRISNVAIWDTGLTLTQRQTILTAYRGLTGQRTDQRIGYILDQAGFPGTDRDLGVGYTTLGPGDHAGQGTLDLLRRVEQTEQGRLFISTDGDATFHARYRGQLVSTVSRATFSDTGDDSPYAQVEINRPRSFVYNKVTVTADGLSAVTVEDAGSITDHGERELTIDAPMLPSGSAQRSLAEYALTNSKDPHMRVSNLSVHLHRDFAGLAPTVLGLEQGDRVTFERTPTGTGSPITADQIIEGYTERFDTHSWTWTPHLSPAEPVTFAVWGGSAVDENEWGTGVWGY